MDLFNILKNLKWILFLLVMLLIYDSNKHMFIFSLKVDLLQGSCTAGQPYSTEMACSDRGSESQSLSGYPSVTRGMLLGKTNSDMFFAP